ncbi:MAG: RNase adapter RapZ [Candidatus Delongbacteria bacterium]
MKNPTISVYSFGYHKSKIPENEHEDGGGFVFDCRFLPNPHHDLKLRDFTGRAKEIEDFFSDMRSVGSFIDDCAKMIKTAADVYSEKHFTDLQVSFGCTGGRHRSVYCAEKFSKILRSQNYSVKLFHTDI